MDYYEAVASQPVNLAASRGTVAAALAELDLQPWREGLFAIAAMGASSHAGHVLAERLACYGRRATNVVSSDVQRRLEHLPVADSYLFVSEGGRSRETIQAAKLAPAGRRLALTNGTASPLASIADAVLPLGHGNDSRVYTVGYTTTLQAFGQLATALDGHDAGDEWVTLPDVVESTLATLAGPAVEAAAMLEHVTSIDFAGDAASYASAAEGALLIREATQISTGVYSTYQYLHGPMEPLTRTHGCILVGEDREVTLAGYLRDKEIPTVLITSSEVEGNDYLKVLQIPAAADISHAILEILPVQIIAGELARRRELEINTFRHSQSHTTKTDSLND